jgi:hypothetical protein
MVSYGQLGGLFQDGIWDFFVTTPYNILGETLRTFPDGLVIGVGFFSIITLSFSYGVFFVSLLESLFVFHGLRSLNAYLNISDAIPTKASLLQECRTGFSKFNMDSLSIFGEGLRSAFPSASLYITSAAASYMIVGMMHLSEELEVLGSEYTSRFYIASVFLPFIILCISFYRLRYSCDALETIVASALVGSIVGMLLVEQNRRIFGDSSLNLIGIPLLNKRTATGDKLYVCPTQVDN